MASSKTRSVLIGGFVTCGSLFATLSWADEFSLLPPIEQPPPAPIESRPPEKPLPKKPVIIEDPQTGELIEPKQFNVTTEKMLKNWNLPLPPPRKPPKPIPPQTPWGNYPIPIRLVRGTDSPLCSPKEVPDDLRRPPAGSDVKFTTLKGGMRGKILYWTKDEKSLDWRNDTQKYNHNMVLVEFEKEDWDRFCTRPVGAGNVDDFHPTLAWIEADKGLFVVDNPLPPLKTVANDESEKGFIDKLWSFFESEENSSESKELEAVSCTDCIPEAKSSPIEDLLANVSPITCDEEHFLYNWRACSIENVRDAGEKALKGLHKCTYMVGEKTKQLSNQQCCLKRMKEEACERSPWRNLDLKERFDQIVARANQKRKADKSISSFYGFEAEALACVAARETGGTLEPMTYAEVACSSGNKDRYMGMLQLVKPTMVDVIENDAFIGLVEPYGNSVYKGPDYELLYQAVGVSVDLQLEMMAGVLMRKRNILIVTTKKKNPSLESIFEAYNGHDEYKVPYARALMKCYNCLKGKQDALSCLSKATGFNVSRNFENYRINFCPKLEPGI